MMCVENDFVRACAGGHVEVARALLKDPRVDPRTWDNEAISLASTNGHVAVVLLLLGDPRVNPRVGNNNPICMASSFGHVEVVRTLIADPRVNPGAYNNKALHHAIYNGKMEVVRILLGDGRCWANRIPVFEKYWITKLVVSGDLDLVEMCLKYDGRPTNEVQGVGEETKETYNRYIRYKKQQFADAKLELLRLLVLFTRRGMPKDLIFEIIQTSGNSYLYHKVDVSGENRTFTERMNTFLDGLYDHATKLVDGGIVTDGKIVNFT